MRRQPNLPENGKHITSMRYVVRKATFGTPKILFAHLIARARGKHCCATTSETEDTTKVIRRWIDWRKICTRDIN